MTQPAPRPGQQGRDFPRVPAYAWAWLQRSRPVLQAVARQLTGEAPGHRFVERLRDEFAADPFTRDVVVAVIADVAFNRRVPRHRPPGVSWDRGLTWWAAAIVGTTPQEFEHPPAPITTQRRLFDAESTGTGQEPARPASAERAMLVGALRELLGAADGDQVPVAAVRQLLEQLERGEDWASLRRRQ